MNTPLRYLLPTMIVPLLTLAANTASAASLDISNGFLTAQAFTPRGYDFSMALSVTLAHNGVSKPTAIELDCVVDQIDEDIDCDGTLTLNGATADIRMDFVGDTETAHWAIEASASNALGVAHEEWGRQIVPETLGLPYPWASIDFFSGGVWRHFYYSTTWAETYQSITGLQYGDIWEL